MFGKKSKKESPVPSYVRFMDGGVGIDVDEMLKDKDFQEAWKRISKIKLTKPKPKDRKN